MCGISEEKTIPHEDRRKEDRNMIKGKSDFCQILCPAFPRLHYTLFRQYLQEKVLEENFKKNISKEVYKIEKAWYNKTE